MRLQLLALAAVAMLATTSVLAGKPQLAQCSDCRVGKQVHCPHCSKPCSPTVSKDMETKHCWCVETKTICIPKVRFPWERHQDCCESKNGCPPPKCGRTKCVRVLVKKEYECPVCKYKFDVEKDANCAAHGKPQFAPGENGTDTPAPPVPTEARRQLHQPRSAVQSVEATEPTADKDASNVFRAFFK